VGRGQRTRKYYVALFVCLATKAIHLESVENYATSFLTAFRQFVSRHGLPIHIYSDNSTNFHGADQKLQTSFQTISSDLTLQVVLANNSIYWLLFLRPRLISEDFGKPGLKVLSFISGELSVFVHFLSLNLRHCVKFKHA